ncbi:MAG: hypothetical protein K2R98_07405 [Gemmataceae bacterium]|nr:hypothetical protein [Gemmataceae bacterium]
MEAPFDQLPEEWQEHVKPYLLDVMPVLTIPMYVMMGLGVLVLLIALWRLVTLRVFRAFFTMLAGLLMAYYPVAYGFHWWYLNADADQMPAEVAEYMKEVPQHWAQIDYGILTGGGVLGALLYWMTMGGRKKKAGYGASESEERMRQQAIPRAGSNKNPWDFK